MNKEDLVYKQPSVQFFPRYEAVLDMGGFMVNLTHTYTDEQIKHIKEYFGWDVRNFEEK